MLMLDLYPLRLCGGVGDDNGTTARASKCPAQSQCLSGLAFTPSGHLVGPGGTEAHWSTIFHIEHTKARNNVLAKAFAAAKHAYTQHKEGGGDDQTFALPEQWYDQVSAIY
jgi:hypothetical protein